MNYLDLYPVYFQGLSSPWLYYLLGLLVLTCGAVAWLCVSLFRNKKKPGENLSGPKNDDTAVFSQDDAT